MENKEYFQSLLLLPHQSVMTEGGVGTLGEKYLHALLKLYLEPDRRFHEVKVGRYTADICKDNSIIEIQTRSLNVLRPKLEAYMQLGYKVTVVYPMAKTKWISWIDTETGEISKRRKSGKKGNFCGGLNELYKIKFFLNNENISVCLMLMDIEELRNLDGYGKDKKKRSTRHERIPLSLEDTLLLEKPDDYIKLLPAGLSSVFSVKDFANAAKMSRYAATCSMSVLRHLGVVKQVGKEKNAYLYSNEQAPCTE